MKEIDVRNYDEREMLDFNEVLRFSPAGLEGPLEPYRCPVSTPAGTRRNSRKSNPNPYVAYTNLNRSMQIPTSSSLSKQSNTRYLYKRRPVANAQTKNFDCYYVNKIKKEAYIDSQTNPSTWLNSLCSQPVDEIFTKYKRKSEATEMVKNSAKTRNVSTPGEKALITAWSSNTSQRGPYFPQSPSTIKSMFSATSRNSKYSVYDNTRLYGYDAESDHASTTIQAPIFALMPVPMSPQREEQLFFTPRESYMASPEMIKLSKTQNEHNLIHESSLLFDSKMYEPYQRDRRFPEMKVRQRSVTPTRKRVSSEPGGTNLSLPSSSRQELQESAIHIISIGQIFDNKEAPVSKPVHRTCSYRLPKTMSTSLPELQGRALNNVSR